MTEKNNGIDIYRNKMNDIRLQRNEIDHINQLKNDLEEEIEIQKREIIRLQHEKNQK